MTGVISGLPIAVYAASIMHQSSRAAALTRLLDSQRAIQERMRSGGGSAPDVLEIGRHVLASAEQEEDTLGSLFPLMDSEVLAELASEHAQIAEDLRLLEWLLSHGADSPDVPALAGSLARRLFAHMERDGRLIARALALYSE